MLKTEIPRIERLVKRLLLHDVPHSSDGWATCKAIRKWQWFLLVDSINFQSFIYFLYLHFIRDSNLCISKTPLGIPRAQSDTMLHKKQPIHQLLQWCAQRIIKMNSSTIMKCQFWLPLKLWHRATVHLLLARIELCWPFNASNMPSSFIHSSTCSFERAQRTQPQRKQISHTLEHSFITRTN